MSDAIPIIINRCTQRWTRLARTDDPAVRYCTSCDTNVHRVHNAMDRRLAELVSTGPCCVSLFDEGLTGGALPMKPFPAGPAG